MRKSSLKHRKPYFLNLFSWRMPLKSNITQFGKKILSINTSFCLNPTQGKNNSQKIWGQWVGLKNLKDVLLYSYSSDRFKVLLSYTRHINLHLNHKNEKSIIFTNFRYLKGAILVNLNQVSLIYSFLVLLSHRIKCFKKPCKKQF